MRLAAHPHPDYRFLPNCALTHARFGRQPSDRTVWLTSLRRSPHKEALLPLSFWVPLDLSLPPDGVARVLYQRCPRRPLIPFTRAAPTAPSSPSPVPPPSLPVSFTWATSPQPSLVRSGPLCAPFPLHLLSPSYPSSVVPFRKCRRCLPLPPLPAP